MFSILGAVGAIGGLLYLGAFCFDMGRSSGYNEAADMLYEKFRPMFKKYSEKKDSKEGEA